MNVYVVEFCNPDITTVPSEIPVTDWLDVYVVEFTMNVGEDTVGDELEYDKMWSNTGNAPPSAGPSAKVNVIEVPVKVVVPDKPGAFGRYAVPVAFVIVRGREAPTGLFATSDKLYDFVVPEVEYSNPDIVICPGEFMVALWPAE